MRGETHLKIDGIVRGGGIDPVQRVLCSVDIEHQIDSSLLQQLHAVVVIGRVVDLVHSNSVDSQLLEVWHISITVLTD